MPNRDTSLSLSPYIDTYRKLIVVIMDTSDAFTLKQGLYTIMYSFEQTYWNSSS